LVHEFVRAWRVDRRNICTPRAGVDMDHVRSAHPAPGAVCRGHSAIFWGQTVPRTGDAAYHSCWRVSEPADSCHGHLCETRVSLSDASVVVRAINKQMTVAMMRRVSPNTLHVRRQATHLTDDVALFRPNSRARVGPRPLMMEMCRISMLWSLRTFMA